MLVPPVLAVPAVTRLELLRGGIARQPESTQLRERLAALLFDRDRFDEAAELLGEPGPEDSAGEHLLLAQILLSRRGAGDAERAKVHATWAAVRADIPAQHEQALLAQARALLQLAHDGEGLELLKGILAVNPDQHGAFRTLTDTLLRRGEGEAVRALVEQMERAGTSHPRRLGALMLAKVQCGDLAAARALSGIDLAAVTTLAVPPGWSDLAAFNAALQAEAEGDPDLRSGRHGTSSRETIRVDHPQRAGAPAFAALHGQIAAEVQRRIAELDRIDHPWVAARPERLVMRSWCVMTGAEGFEEWHNHPAGWMSGGYYVAVPEVRNERTGSLAFGVPPRLAGAEASAAFGEVLVPPSPGMLALFPSHAYHRTYPHGQPGRRICVAFDLEPG